jgi:type IV fimbrial biogenesis protein FimT
MELIITIALVAILAALAVPNFREFLIRMNVSESTNELVHALNLARSDAVRRGKVVLVEPVSSDWSNGWVVRCEECAPPADPSDPWEDQELLRVEKSSDYEVTALANAVQFLGDGSLAGSATAFRICRPAADANAEENRLVEVHASGVIASRKRGSADPTANNPPTCG